VLHFGGPGDQVVVQIHKKERPKVPQRRVHEPLEYLRSVLQAEWHAQELKLRDWADVRVGGNCCTGATHHLASGQYGGVKPMDCQNDKRCGGTSCLQTLPWRLSLARWLGGYVALHPVLGIG